MTTTRITHATPAASYASSPERDWEGTVPDQCKDTVKDIAHQLIYGDYSKDFRVGMKQKHRKEIVIFYRNIMLQFTNLK